MSRVVLVLIVGALGGGLGSCGDYPPEIEWVEWVTIPAGSFEMGSNEGEDNEMPVHRVTLRSFQMSKTEVTVAQYNACVAAGACTAPGCDGVDDHPVACVDWGQARTFAKWIGADVDLPTEAEWEYAARGGQSFTYAGSESPDDVAWYDDNSESSTQPVGTKRANGYGLHDMSGNVWEWVLDEYRYYEGAPSDGHQAVGLVPTCRMMCDNGAARRVNRGGSWLSVAGSLRVAYRRSFSPDYRNDNLGLRLRRTLP